MKKLGCAKCGGTKKMKLGGSAVAKAPVNIFGIPQQNLGTSGQSGNMKKGGSVKDHPITVFRKANEARQKLVKAQFGMSTGTTKTLPKAQFGAIAKAVGKYAKPAMDAAKSAVGYAKPTVKKVADTYKKAKATSYAKKTSHLKRSEDWDKFHAAQNDKKLLRGASAIGAGSIGAAMYNKPKKK